MWLITHLPPFFISSASCWMKKKRKRRSRSSRRRMRAKEEVLGWEAYTAVVALFISIIVQAGLWALERCFVCQTLQPWGYGGLAFPTINIQRDSHLEPRPALLRFGFIYLFLFNFFSSVLFFLYPSDFSYQCVVQLFYFIYFFDTLVAIYHTCSYV